MKKYCRENKFLLLVIFVISICFYFYLIRDSYQLDFRGYYITIKSFVNGLNPYLNNIKVSQEYYLGDSSWAWSVTSPFVYPPTFLLFFFPLAFLSYAKAKIVFSFIMGLLIVCIIVFYYYRYRIKNELVILIFLSYPVLISFERGQIDIYTLFLILSFFFLKEKWYSGIFLSIGILMKIWPAFILPYFIFRKEFKPIISTLVSLITMLLVSSFFININLYKFFLGNFFRTFFTDGLSTPIFRSEVNPLSYFQSGFNVFVSGRNYIFSHSYVPGKLNPLVYLGAWQYLIGLFLILASAYIFSRNKDKELDELYFYMYLILALSINKLLWITSLVCYIPLAFFLLNRFKDDFKHTLLIILPLIAPTLLFRGRLNYVFAVSVCVYFYIYFHIKEENKIRKVANG